MSAQNVQLSSKVKKLSKDFAVKDGQLQMSMEKVNHWVGELEKLSGAEKPKIAQELVALALKFEREGKETAALGTAQLYFFAAGLITPTAEEDEKKPAPKAAKGAKGAKSGGGWGAKSKR
jgi:hypothetical protein